MNISTQNILAEGNIFKKGHGVSIGSETGGWCVSIACKYVLLTQVSFLSHTGCAT